jgi:hypothetical protein
MERLLSSLHALSAALRQEGNGDWAASVDLQVAVLESALGDRSDRSSVLDASYPIKRTLEAIDRSDLAHLAGFSEAKDLIYTFQEARFADCLSK